MISFDNCVGAVAGAAILATAAGCLQGTWLRAGARPAPEGCPAGARRTMELLQLRPGDTARVLLDANQMDYSPIVLFDGPIESVLDRDLGTLWSPTRLYGRVWTAGPDVTIRYYEAQRPDGQTIPICAVARLGGGKARKLPGSKPGMAILEDSSATVLIVTAFP